jgi:hypothetical protein
MRSVERLMIFIFIRKEYREMALARVKETVQIYKRT